MKHPENDASFKGLKVNSGVEQPASLNPYLNSMRLKRAARLTADDYVNGILRGDVNILSRAVTLVESRRYEDAALAREVVERCLRGINNTSRAADREEERMGPADALAWDSEMLPAGGGTGGNWGTAALRQLWVVWPVG